MAKVVSLVQNTNQISEIPSLSALSVGTTLIAIATNSVAALLLSYDRAAVNEAWSDSCCLAFGCAPPAQVLVKPLLLLALVASSHSWAWVLTTTANFTYR